MRILHIIPTYKPAYKRGGPIWSVHALNRWLIKRGVDVTVYTTDIDVEEEVSLNKEVDVDGVKVWYFPASYPNIWKYRKVGFIPAFFPRHWEYSKELHDALRANTKEFDLIHITSIFLFASILGAFYVKKNKKPYIISPRGSLMEPLEFQDRIKKKIYIHLFERYSLAGARAIHFTTEHERSEYIRYGFPIQKSVIIPNGLDMGELNFSAQEGEFRKKFDIPEDKKIILFLGRISWKKGVDTLIPAFAEVAKGNDNVVLVLAGGDDVRRYKSAVEKMIDEHNIRDKVIFTGEILKETKTSAYEESDVFVLPSYSENFGMTVLEAMYMGLPIVISKNVGIAPEVEQSGAGLVIDKDKDQLVKALNKVLGDSKLSSRLGKNGKKVVERYFSWSSVSESFAKLYNDLINNNYGK